MRRKVSRANWSDLNLLNQKSFQFLFLAERLIEGESTNCEIRCLFGRIYVYRFHMPWACQIGSFNFTKDSFLHEKCFNDNLGHEREGGEMFSFLGQSTPWRLRFFTHHHHHHHLYRWKAFSKIIVFPFSTFSFYLFFVFVYVLKNFFYNQLRLWTWVSGIFMICHLCHI